MLAGCLQERGPVGEVAVQRPQRDAGRFGDLAMETSSAAFDSSWEIAASSIAVRACSA